MQAERRCAFHIRYSSRRQAVV